jgi:hypothetical protein
MHASSPVRAVVLLATFAAAAPNCALAQTAPQATPAPAASGNPLADFYLAKLTNVDLEQEFELRLRADGKAWLVSAFSKPATSRFETGTWHPSGAKVTVLLDTTAAVLNGSPASPAPETETLTFSLQACTLALVSAVPATLPGAGGLKFTKRRCP